MRDALTVQVRQHDPFADDLGRRFAALAGAVLEPAAVSIRMTCPARRADDDPIALSDVEHRDREPAVRRPHRRCEDGRAMRGPALPPPMRGRRASRSAAVTAAASYAMMAAAGGGATPGARPGVPRPLPTTRRIASTSQRRDRARRTRPQTECRRGEGRDAAEHREPDGGNDERVGEHRVRRALARTSRRSAATRRSASLTVNASASRTRAGTGVRASACSIGRANSTIAPTHENDNANETVVTAAGQITATVRSRRARARSTRRCAHRTRAPAAPSPRPSRRRAAMEDGRR